MIKQNGKKKKIFLLQDYKSISRIVHSTWKNGRTRFSIMSCNETGALRQPAHRRNGERGKTKK